MIGLIKGTARQVKSVSGLPLPIATYNGNLKAPIKKLSLSINPTQAGSGDPYPAGGGNNKLPPFTNGTYTQNGIKAVVKDGLITVTGQKDTASGINLTLPLSKTFTLKQNDYLHIRNSNSNASITLSFAGAGWSPAFASTNRIIQYTGADASVTSVTIYFAGTVTEKQNFTFQPSLEVSSAVTDWTPYDNIRPITGVSSVNLYDAGASLANVNDVSGSINNGYFYSIPTDYTLEANVAYKLTMVVNSTVEPFAISVGVGDDSSYRADIAYTNIVKRNGVVSIDFTPTSTNLQNWNKLWFRAPRYSTPQEAHQTTCTFTVTNIVLSTSVSTYNLPLGSTYYGGNIDIVDGEAVMTVDKFYAQPRTFDSFGTNSYGHKRARYVNSDIKNVANLSMCNVMKYQAGGFNYGSINTFYNSDGTAWFTFDENVITSLAEAEQFMSDNNVECIFPLKTPFTVNLGSVSIPSLLGQNNIWHDGNGDVDELVYQNRQLYYGR